MRQFIGSFAALVILIGFSLDPPQRPLPQATLPPTWTPAPSFTPLPTRTPAASSTPFPTQTFTPTFTPTFTATATRPPFANAEWTPVEQLFDGVVMVLVPPHCFTMGATEAQVEAQVQAGFSWTTNQLPAHEQCFDEPFWIDKYEVTQADFARQGGQRTVPPYVPGDTYPVDYVTWFEAHDFCVLRGGRLPTEREWEYAARGPDNWVYPWGNEWNEANLVWNTGTPAPVGSNPAGASWVGALDMSGNVWEWVSTIFGVYDAGRNEFIGLFEYPYQAEDGREVVNEDAANARVIRGGAWFFNYPQFFYAFYRDGDVPQRSSEYGGFRCAREVD